VVDRKKIWDGVAEYLVGETDLDKSISEISDSTDIKKDLEFDSLQLATMVLDLEEDYEIDIADEITSLVTVGDVVDLIVKLKEDS